jgi:hypothetical protein
MPLLLRQITSPAILLYPAKTTKISATANRLYQLDIQTTRSPCLSKHDYKDWATGPDNFALEYFRCLNGINSKQKTFAA